MLIIVSLILAALIVRIIYVWYDVIISAIEETYDENYRDHGLKTSILLGSAILVTGICLFAYIIIWLLWESYVRRLAQTPP